MKRVAILGAGGMGTALAVLFGRRRGRCSSGRATPRTRPSWRGRGRTPATCPASRCPSDVEVTPNACDATGGADLIVAAIPSAFLRATLDGLAERIPPGIPVLSVVKGIENATFARPSQIIVETLGPAAGRGPERAEPRRGAGAGLPASVVVGGDDEALNAAVRDALNQGLFRVYTNPDALGRRAGRGLEKHPGDRRGDMRRPRLRR